MIKTVEKKYWNCNNTNMLLARKFFLDTKRINWVKWVKMPGATAIFSVYREKPPNSGQALNKEQNVYSQMWQFLLNYLPIVATS